MGPGPHSQLEDEHHVGAVLIDVVQRDDVGVQHLPQDAHLPLDLLPAHTPTAGPALPLLDELGGILQPRALLPALLHDGKLAAVGTRDPHNEGVASGGVTLTASYPDNHRVILPRQKGTSLAGGPAWLTRSDRDRAGTGIPYY